LRQDDNPPRSVGEPFEHSHSSPTAAEPRTTSDRCAAYDPNHCIGTRGDSRSCSNPCAGRSTTAPRRCAAAESAYGTTNSHCSVRRGQLV